MNGTKALVIGGRRNSSGICQPQHKFFYAVPNFQNPTGITYTNAVREKIADAMKGKDTFFVEDNPYGELRFKGEHQRSLYTYLEKWNMLDSKNILKVQERIQKEASSIINLIKEKNVE